MREKADLIIKIVSKEFGVPPEKVRATGREGDTLDGRHGSIGLIKAYLGFTLKQIGSEFSDRDHSTIMHSLKKWYKDYVKDPQFRKKLNKANAKVAKALGVKLINLYNTVGDEKKKKEIRKRRSEYMAYLRAKFKEEAIKLKLEKERVKAVVRPSHEMPTIKNEWLKPLSKNNLNKSEIVKPVYF